MKILNEVSEVNFISKFFKPKNLAISLLLAVIGVIGYHTLSNSFVLAALPKDCEDNSIIYCGVQNTDEFRNKYKANATRDLVNLYKNPFNNSVASSGLTPDEIDRFAKDAVMGYAYRNGDVKLLDGTLVMTDAWSLGREGRNDSRRVKITLPTGENYYKSILEVGYHKNTEKIPVFILFNSDGEVEFAVLNSCGNPVWGTNKKPEYRCDSLKADPAGKNSFNFSVNYFEKNNAKITSATYDFGDGNTKTVTNNTEKFAYKHTYTKAGKYTAKVSLTVTLPGGFTKTIHCQTEVDIPEEKNPEYKCDSLTGKLIQGNRKYRFELIATAKDGAELSKVDFNFGDGQMIEGIVPQTKTGKIIVTVDHEYAKTLTGKKTITSKLYFNVKNKVETRTCSTDIELSEPTCADKPNAPECQPPVEECKPNIPKGDDRCKEVLPKEIVKTGPAEVIASALGLSGAAGAGMYYRASRKNLMDKIFKR